MFIKGGLCFFGLVFFGDVAKRFYCFPAFVSFSLLLFFASFLQRPSNTFSRPLVKHVLFFFIFFYAVSVSLLFFFHSFFTSFANLSLRVTPAFSFLHDISTQVIILLAVPIFFKVNIHHLFPYLHSLKYSRGIHQCSKHHPSVTSLI